MTCFKSVIILWIKTSPICSVLVLKVWLLPNQNRFSKCPCFPTECTLCCEFWLLTKRRRSTEVHGYASLQSLTKPSSALVMESAVRCQPCRKPNYFPQVGRNRLVISCGDHQRWAAERPARPGPCMLQWHMGMSRWKDLLCHEAITPKPTPATLH